MSENNKLFTDGNHTVDLTNGITDLHKIAKEVWNSEPYQLKYTYDDENQYWRVDLTDTLGKTSKLVGAINFDPNEN